MAHHGEPMDVDCIDNDFDNKENTFHHSNVHPCTEKGYEELDVSELNMKLRYSMTPASSPMSKSYTASLDNRNVDTDEFVNYSNENSSLTRSLNSTVNKNDSVIKSLKSLPLQSLPTEQFIDGNGNPSVLRQFDSTITYDANVTVTMCETNDINENLSVPSSLSSALQTPEATTPTKEIAKDGGSPIMRGLKSVLNMFRPSQSPIPPVDNDIVKHETSATDVSTSENAQRKAVASTPIAAHRTKDGNSSKRSSPLKDSIVFKDDLEKELNWKDETTILFSEEKIPIHKLFFQNSKPSSAKTEPYFDIQNANIDDNFNSTVEYMDVSNNESLIQERTMTELQPDHNKNEVSITAESDCEFVDCETYSKNESQLLVLNETESTELLPVLNTQNLNVTSKQDNVNNVNVLSDITGFSFIEVENKNDVTEPSDYSDYSKETNDILSELEKLEKEELYQKDLHEDVSKTKESIEVPFKTSKNEESKLEPVENILENKEILEKSNTQEDDLPKIELQEIVLGNENEYPETNLLKDDQENREIPGTQHILDKTNIQENDMSKLNSQDIIPENKEMVLETCHNQDRNENLDSKQLKTQDIMSHGNISENLEEKSKEVILASLISEEDKEKVTVTQENKLILTEKIGNMPAEEKISNMMELLEPQNPILNETYNESQTTKSLGVTQSTQNHDGTNVSKIAYDLSIDASNHALDPIKTETSLKQDINNVENQSMYDAHTVQLMADSLKTCIDTQNKDAPQIYTTEEEQHPVDIPLPIELCPKESLEIVHSPLKAMETVVTPETLNVLEAQNPSDVPLPDEDDTDKESLTEECPAILHEETTAIITPCEIPDVKMNNLNVTKTEEDKTKIDSALPAATTFLETIVPQHHEVPEVSNPESELNATLTFNELPLQITPASKIEQETTCFDLNITKSLESSGVYEMNQDMSSVFNVTKTFNEKPLETAPGYDIQLQATSPDLNVTKTYDEKSQETSNSHEATHEVSSTDLNITETVCARTSESSPQFKIEQDLFSPDLNVTTTYDENLLVTGNNTKEEATSPDLNENPSEAHETDQEVTSAELNTTETLKEKILEYSPQFEIEQDIVSPDLNVTTTCDENSLVTRNNIKEEATSPDLNENPLETYETAQEVSSAEWNTTETLKEKMSESSSTCEIKEKNTSSELNDTKTFNENALEALPQNIIQQESSMPDSSITLHQETEPNKTLSFTTSINSNLCAIPTIDKSSPESLQMNMSIDEAYDDVACHAVKTIDDCIDSSNSLNAIIMKENLEHAVNKTEGVEPMDITMNETFNQTQELPDLVNQTAVLTEQVVTKDIDTSEVIATLDITSAIKETNKEDEIDIVTVMKVDSKVMDTVVPVQQNHKTPDLRNQDILASAVLDDDNSNDPDIKINNQPNETLDAKVQPAHNVEKEAINVDEEIIVSGNNSPYVSLMADVEGASEKVEETFEEIENTFVSNSNVASSPPITSKGYNFNFDEIEDPFATKTKIRLSPPIDTPVKTVESNNEKNQFELPKKGPTNRRKSQPPERKKSAALKKKFNTTIHSDSSSKLSNKKEDAIKINTPATEINVKEQYVDEIQDEETTENKTSYDETRIVQNDDKNKENYEHTKFENNIVSNDKPHEIRSEIKTHTDSFDVLNDLKTTSSSEQSAYYSVGSSTESMKAKNVFNLPEIDDMNFNPFATKSKMRQSPPLDQGNENTFATRTKIKSSPDSSIIVSSKINPVSGMGHEEKSIKVCAEDKTETELMEKATCNISNETSSSSKDTEYQDITTREVNTEDEDTIEGPFLEADNVSKMLDFETDNADMMQFNELPDHGNDDNMEGEIFIDAEAYEFLLNQNKSNVVADSGKESLFLKFDPLFAKRVSSDGVLAALSNVQKRQSTPTKAARPSFKNEASPISGPSTLNVTFDGDNNVSLDSNEDANITVAKPMMVVTPAVNPVVTPRNKSVTPTRSNRRSITFTSPAIAVIDRLLSMSGNNSFIGQDTTITSANRELNEADIVLTQLRDLLAEKEISVCNLRSESKELKDRLCTMLSQVNVLETDGQERLKRINELNERLAEKAKINKSMAAVVEEYERTIASLIAEIEQDKKRNAEERIRLINERDEQIAHLASMEVSFSDLHSKYEKSKQIILECKANEETYKKSLKDFEESLTKMQANYETLKQHATAKLNNANQELEKMNRGHAAEVVKLNAMIKRKDIHITSLEETLAQKTKANEELTAICDELINTRMN